MPTSTLPNRRRHARQAPRMVEITDAWANYDGSRQPLEGVVLRDLGDGGLGIECTEYLTPGDRLELKLLAGRGEGVSLVATICHRRSLSEGRGFHYGLYINHLPHEQDRGAASAVMDLLNPA